MLVAASALGFAVSSSASAWTYDVLCPDEEPGPPDCFTCELFGDTLVLDSDTHFAWSAHNLVGTFPGIPGGGSFDPNPPHGFGYAMNSVHYTCPYSGGSKRIFLAIDSEILGETYDYRNIHCSTFT